MINRLVAESTIKAPFRGQPYFSISKKMLCFQADTYLKIKNLSRDAKDIDIPFNNTPLKFVLSQLKPWLYELTVDNLLQVYHVQYINGITDGSFKKIAIFHNVQDFYQVKNGVLLNAVNKTLKFVSFLEIITSTEINLNIQTNSLKSVCQVQQNSIVKASSFSERFFVIKARNQSQNENTVEVFDKILNTNAYQKPTTITYLNQILTIYRQRYIFQRKQEKQIQIYDIEESKLIGGFTLQGTIKYSQTKENLLVIITNKDLIDYFHFFVLNPEPSSLQPLITNRVSYQKGKGDFYKLYNLSSIEAATIIDKKKNTDINDDFIAKINDNTSTLVYILNKTKQKVEIIKLDHSKLLKSPFGEEKMNKIVYSKKSNDAPAASVELVELERSRIHSAIEIKHSEKSMEELQKKFVQNLIQIKMQSVLRKFQQLEKRVQRLEKQVRKINQKLQQNISSINREQIKQNVEKLFDSLTPQFQNYFTQIFKQVAGVLQQGVSYYNMKIAKQAQFHKDALTQIVTQTFKATEEIVQLSRREQRTNEDAIKKVLQCKKKWTKSTEEYETRLKEVPSPNLKGAVAQSKGEGKVFVRADLNYPNAKRQT